MKAEIYRPPRGTRYPNKIRTSGLVFKRQVLPAAMEGEGVLHVPDPHGIPRHQHSDHVESIRVTLPSVPVDPHQSRSAQLTLLSPADGGDRAAKPVATPRLHLHERHHRVALDNEVQVAMPRTEAAIQYTPSVPAQPALGDPLAELAQVLPLDRHAANLAGERVSAVIVVPQGEAHGFTILGQ